MRRTFITKMVAVGLVLMTTGTARAQAGNDDVNAKALRGPQVIVTKAMAQALSRPTAIAEFSPLSSAWQQPSSRRPFHSRSTVGRKIAYGVAGGFLGMLAGGGIGGAMTQHCCGDDPGLAGAMVGMPLGAALGASFGVFLSGR
jgi:hypothetical protein